MKQDSRALMRTWAIIAAIAVLMLLWISASLLLIGDRPPTWNYGQPPVVPGDSYYTAGRAPTGEKVPQQVPPAPQAREPAQ